jgi:hypothetical protein
MKKTKTEYILFLKNFLFFLLKSDKNVIKSSLFFFITRLFPLKNFLNKMFKRNQNKSSNFMVKSNSKVIEQKVAHNSYNTVTSQKSFLSIDSNVASYPHGEIEFIDGLQRLKRVFKKQKHCIKSHNHKNLIYRVILYVYQSMQTLKM